ncbi:MAG: hypothetical protein HOH04_01275 [Rhodospirillaceae bacterium]|nr:hypothetical protein [Rhodospirillaceae bacterium]
MMTFSRLWALAALAFVTFSGTSFAAPDASNWIETEQTRVRLLAAQPALGTGDVQLGLQFELQPGWKIYWRSPGDAGFPPRLDWKGSTNLATATVHWPTPTRFSVLGLETLGYKKHVVLPITAKPANAGDELDLKAQLRYLVCDEICIPYETNLSLALPSGPATPGPHAHTINRYAASVPGDGRTHGLEITKLDTWNIGKSAMLRISARATAAFTAPDVFMEGPPGLAYAKPLVRLSDDGKEAVLDVRVDGVDFLEDAVGKTLAARDFTATLVDGGRAAEAVLTATETAPAQTLGQPLASSIPVSEAAMPSLALMLVFAIIGGLILNLMPCVLPVLSLKMLSLVKHGGGNPRDVRMGFLASAAGIVSTFLVLAVSLAALRSGGAAIGWGIQFQQPWFLTLLVLLVTIFACNLWGFFEVRLPGIISDMGEHTAHVHGLGGHFLQGAFATLLATPCTAPFLGTAVGFALAGSVVDIVAVFAALGVGLSLPYLAVAAMPGLATWLPRPGSWMVKLKAVLGLLLAGTGVWLLYVLAGVAGETGSIVVGVAAVVTAGVLFTAHRTGGLGLRLSAPGMSVLAAIALSAPLWAPVDAKTGGGPGESAALKAIWKPFDPAAIPGLVQAGKTVFVDVTADWCITCQVNKGVVMERRAVLGKLGSENVIAMQADWTRPDDGIARYLASFGRFGIPFNVVYGPKAPQGIVLPELLTESAVLGGFDGAGTPAALAKRK